MLTVVGTTWTDRVETVYNFGVDGFHTYFVGESGAWVHNCFNTPWAEMSKAERKRLRHVYDKANERGLNLPNFRESQADSARKALNATIEWIESRAQIVQHSTNAFDALPSPA